jgi:hypothetical protein
MRRGSEQVMQPCITKNVGSGGVMFIVSVRRTLSNSQAPAAINETEASPNKE